MRPEITTAGDSKQICPCPSTLVKLALGSYLLWPSSTHRVYYCKYVWSNRKDLLLVHTEIFLSGLKVGGVGWTEYGQQKQALDYTVDKSQNDNNRKTNANIKVPSIPSLAS